MDVSAGDGRQPRTWLRACGVTNFATEVGVEILQKRVGVRDDTIIGEVKTFLAEAFPLADGIDRLGDDDSLLDTGVLDSMGVLELVGFLEDRYHIEVPDEDLRPEYLDSLSRIRAYVESRQSRPAEHT